MSTTQGIDREEHPMSNIDKLNPRRRMVVRGMIGAGLGAVFSSWGIGHAQPTECEGNRVKEKTERTSRGRSSSGNEAQAPVQTENQGRRRRDWGQLSPDQSASV